jgi:3-hydroxyisobutyrate dehydrogenase-like beta-hydroxyacid dehydrogenase
MGAAVGAALTRRGYTVHWLPDGRSDATRARAADANLLSATGLHKLVGTSDVVVSVVPPEAAMSTARDVLAAGFSGLYLDANAISPETSRAIASLVSASGAAFVDAAIVGGPPRGRGEARLFLSGARAEEVAQLFDASSFEAVCVGDTPGAASAVKCAYAAYTKGGGALLLAVRAYARAAGVERTLLEEWDRSQPGLETRSEIVARTQAPKAWRFSAEMKEIEAAFDAAGIPGGFFGASAEVNDRLRPFKDAADADPHQVFDALQADGRAE